MARNLHSNDHLARSIDFGCILVAFAGASGIASLLSSIGLFIWPDVPNNNIKGWPTDYVILLIVALVLWAIVAEYSGVHRVNRIESAEHSYWRLVRTLSLWLGMTGTTIFFLKLQIVSRQFNLSFFGLASVLISLRQFVERVLTAHSAYRRPNLRSAIIIGPQRESEWLLNVLSARPEWYGAVAHADLERVKAILNGASNEDLDGSHAEVAEVFILPGNTDQKQVEDWELRLLRKGRIVHVIPSIIDAQLFRQNLGDIAGVPTLTLETGSPGDLETGFKRAADVIASGFLLVVFAPVMGLIAVLIKVTSPGPAIFAQKRLGKAGAPFRIFKFRTMRTDAEEILRSDRELHRKYLENNFKLPEGEDVRVTKLGRVLRATSLDELPQLVNVLRGEMSLVGPRPIVPDELQKYGEYASLLLMVKPGLTGNWQVNGRSRIVEYSERVKLDMEYVRDQSLNADLRILVRTVGAVARMDGAH
jgi:exopolysaccharide biosynthesis polyprenyl glycosylphosphotransferase